MSRSTGIAALVGCLLAWSFASAAPAAGAVAIPVGAPSRSSVPVAASVGLSVLFVLDVSGSMNRTLPGSKQTLLDGAKQALSRVSTSMPEAAKVGLRVYGAEYAGTDRAKSCADTQLRVPVEAGSPKRLSSATRSLTAVGDTPISRSLSAAGRDFTDADDARVVVLISDGEDTCSPPDPAPCEAAKDLQRNRVKVRVETVGFHLGGNREAVDALRCVARVSNGNYYSADDADALAAALNRIAERTLSQLGPGRPVDGGRRIVDAPVIRPGVYTDSIRPGQTKWYRFEATKGDHPEVLATVEGLPSILVPKRGRECRSWTAQLFNPFEEGGKYPPYLNDNIFDGAGLAGTGVRTVERIRPDSDDKDFPGTWSIALSLARETIDTCSDYLPRKGFGLQLSLTTGAGNARTTDDTGGSDGKDDPAGSSGQTSAPPTEPDDSTSAADKYRTPVSASEGSPWALPATAVAVVLVLAGLVGGFLRWRRTRYF